MRSKKEMKFLKNYLHRFVPYQAFKNPQNKHTLQNSSNLIHSESLIQDLTHLLSLLNERVPLPFTLNVIKSYIPHAGNGVILKGKVDQGAIVALYPGTVYSIGDALFLASIMNPYILRCFDGIYVDGKHNGISKNIYLSLANMHSHAGLVEPIADIDWLVQKNPLALGQIINNGTREFPPNVHYQELNLPIDFPFQLRPWIPNIHYSRSWNPCTEFTRIVVLIANRTIHNEELYSTYHENVL